MNPKQQKFAELVASGLPASRAYEQAGYIATGHAAESSASKLLKSPEVEEYLAGLQDDAAKESKLTRDAAAGMLVDILRSKPSEANMDNPLCELRMSKMGPYAAFPSKAACMERLARLLGWDKLPPEPAGGNDITVTIGGDANEPESIQSVMLRIRKQRAPDDDSPCGVCGRAPGESHSH